MKRLIVTGDNLKVNFNPSTEEEEILQNLRTILSTVKYSVPLDRSFGVAAGFVDAPTPEARALAENAYFNAIRKYEPRVVVEKITWEETVDGILRPKVQVIISDS